MANLDAECESKFPLDSDATKQQFCKDVADVFVQIPPALFKGMDDLAWPIPLGMCATLYQCEVACCGEDDPPEQVHISLATNDLSLMGVTWVTLNDKASIVQYGLHPNLMTFVDFGSLSTYRAAGKVVAI